MRVKKLITLQQSTYEELLRRAKEKKLKTGPLIRLLLLAHKDKLSQFQKTKKVRVQITLDEKELQELIKDIKNLDWDSFLQEALKMV